MAIKNEEYYLGAIYEKRNALQQEYAKNGYGNGATADEIRMEKELDRLFRNFKAWLKRRGRGDESIENMLVVYACAVEDKKNATEKQEEEAKVDVEVISGTNIFLKDDGWHYVQGECRVQTSDKTVGVEVSVRQHPDFGWEAHFYVAPPRMKQYHVGYEKLIDCSPAGDVDGFWAAFLYLVFDGEVKKYLTACYQALVDTFPAEYEWEEGMAV